jgi:putative methyltransferase
MWWVRLQPGVGNRHVIVHYSAVAAAVAYHPVLQSHLQESLQSLLQQAGVSDAAAWLAAQQQPQQHQQQQQMVPHPRFARVNTLKASMQEVLTQLTAEAATNKQQQQDKQAKQRAKHASSAAAVPVVDELLPDLLVFPAGTDLHDHPLVQQGVLILQVTAAAVQG